MSRTKTSATPFVRWISLACVMTLIVGICFVLLPELARHESVRTRIEFHESKRIEGNATYYTELEYTRELLKRKNL